MKIYLVGGAVRDELLGLVPKERDWVVVGSTPDEMLKKGFTGVGKSFPVFLHPQTKEEYALARTEKKVAGGYRGFVFNTASSVTLEEDLARRDLTINAMAKTEQGEIIDPYGGQQDLNLRILRHVSLAFIEDPVRVLRVARFAARFAPWGFTVAPETLDLMRQIGEQGELDYLVPERVWKEMERALSEKSCVTFIQILRQSDTLKKILPELDTIPVERNLQQAALLSDLPQVRFAAMLTKAKALVRQLCQRLRVPRDFQQLAELVAKWHVDCDRIAKHDIYAILTLLERCDAFRRSDRLSQFLLSCEADFRARPGFETVDYLPKKILSRALTAARSIDMKTIVAQFGSSGDAMKKAIHDARIRAITHVLGQPF